MQLLMDASFCMIKLIIVSFLGAKPVLQKNNGDQPLTLISGFNA